MLPGSLPLPVGKGGVLLVSPAPNWRGNEPGAALEVIAERIIAPSPQELLNLVHNGVGIHIRPWVLILVIRLFEAFNVVCEFRVGVDLFVQRRLQLDGLFLNLLKIKR